jgi:tight adherence protein B
MDLASMAAGLSLSQLKCVAILATVAGASAAGALLLGVRRGLPAKIRDRRFARLRKDLARAGLGHVRPEHVTIAQGSGLALAAAATAINGAPLGAVVVLATIVLPSFLIERHRRKRVATIERQVDGFLTKMANALRVTSSIGDALRWLETALEGPLLEEVARTNRDMRLGQPLDGALLDLGQRAGSPTLAASITAMLIARRTGGDLARNLDAMAASLREMGRLVRVLQTKTAEGRVQLWVLGSVPFGMAALLNTFSPGYFDVVGRSFFGLVLAAVAAVLWIVAVVIARRVLDVDM